MTSRLQKLVAFAAAALVAAGAVPLAGFGLAMASGSHSGCPGAPLVAAGCAAHPCCTLSPLEGAPDAVATSSSGSGLPRLTTALAAASAAGRVDVSSPVRRPDSATVALHSRHPGAPLILLC